MKLKITTLCMVMVLGIIMMSVSIASADGHGKSYGKTSMDEKLLRNIHMILMNADELALTDEQTEELKSLKLNTKKAVIKMNAEIEVLAVDIMSEMWEDNIDLDKVNALIDSKYDIKQEKEKLVVAASAKVKEIVTEEQKSTIKQLMKKHDDPNSKCEKHLQDKK